MKALASLTLAVFGAAIFNLAAATLYVSLESPNPTPPFTNWNTAARVIQDAVDAAKAGDTVLVTNGVYATGGRAVGTNVLANRVAVDKPLTLRSVNGPQFTLIQGAKDPAGYSGRGDCAIRCVYLSDGASLSGFTLTNGATRPLWSLEGPVPDGSGGGVWCGSTNAVLINCNLTRNSAAEGGGARLCTLYSCTLDRNEAFNGGGSSQSTLNNCTLTGNTADMTFGTGGGANGGRLNNCTLTGNSADCGGGAAGDYWACTLNNCKLKGNWGYGGGAVRATLYNCLLTENLRSGALVSTLYSCTVVGNLGDGAAVYSTLYNCVVYHNSGANYDDSTTLNYCCTTPLPMSGVGNVALPPLFRDMAAGDFRLREDSPCIDAGTDLFGYPMMVYAREVGGSIEFVIGGLITDPTDILGNTRFIDGNEDGKVAWDIGAYEFNSFKPPRFSGSPMRTAKCWVFRITGEPGKQVRLQRTSNFTAWRDLEPPTLIGEDGTSAITDANTGPTTMFYRVVVP